MLSERHARTSKRSVTPSRPLSIKRRKKKARKPKLPKTIKKSKSKSKSKSRRSRRSSPKKKRKKKSVQHRKNSVYSGTVLDPFNTSHFENSPQQPLQSLTIHPDLYDSKVETFQIEEEEVYNRPPLQIDHMEPIIIQSIQIPKPKREVSLSIVLLLAQKGECPDHHLERFPHPQRDHSFDL